MKKDLYKVSVFLSVLGLVLMYASSLYISIEKVDVRDIEESWNGKNVRLSGEIEGYSNTSGHIFFDLNDSTDTIKVADFDSTNYGIESGDTVNITGHVTMYKGELEVISKEIENYDPE